MVGRDLVETLENRFAWQTVPKHTMINNWIDEKEIYPLPHDNSGAVEFRKKYGLENKFIIMYSGNIDLCYDLEGLIQVIEWFIGFKIPDGRNVVVAFAGGMLDKLVLYKKEYELNNVVFISYQG